MTTESSALPVLVLGDGKERSLERRHPWIFSGAVRELRGSAGLGDSVLVTSSSGKPLAVAAYSSESKIRARVWSFDPNARIDASFFAARVAQAVALRTAILPQAVRAACRLVHGESDGLPGVIADRYGDCIVLALTSAGAVRHRDAIARALADATGCENIYERSDADVMALEGLTPQSGALLGTLPDAPLEIEEHGARFMVDARAGHKTGFYLDQRDNRALVRAHASGRDVLDCFSYSAGFAIQAALGGARSVLAIDASPDALEQGKRNAALSGLAEGAVEFERADVFEWLRKARDQAKSFDLIVLDPPKFAPTARLAERAARGYKDINLFALKLLRPGGLLFTFSCSGGVSPELFQKIVAGAAADARADVSVLQKLGAASDHPIALAFPEGEYLKGLVCRRA
jgi:23S rRNA (cytosine1962-C5)-methyltransferase